MNIILLTLIQKTIPKETANAKSSLFPFGRLLISMTFPYIFDSLLILPL